MTEQMTLEQVSEEIRRDGYEISADTIDAHLTQHAAMVEKLRELEDTVQELRRDRNNGEEARMYDRIHAIATEPANGH